MYYLMNKDVPIMSFEVGIIGDAEYCYGDTMLETIPFWITDIETWVVERSAAKHRKHVHELLKAFGGETISGFIRLTHCLSVNDTLWVKSDREYDLAWNAVSLYRNEFDEVVAKLSFDGDGLYGNTFSTTSPEFTTDGAFDKCWIRGADGIHLIKVGSSGASNAGRESYSEVLASQIYNILTDDSVRYNLKNFHGKVVSDCLLFTNEDYGFKSMAACGIKSKSIPRLMAEMSECGSEDTFRRMIVGDSITVNTDRHFGNFGFLVDNATFSRIRMAPIFDFNMAMFPYADWYEGFPNMERWIEERGPMLGSDYYTIMSFVMNPSIRADLINLKDYTLQLECDSKFDKQRLDICNRFKNLQIDKLLGNRVQFDFTDIKRKYNGGSALSRLANN